MVMGVDNMKAGYDQMLTGEPQRTYLNKGVAKGAEAVGFEPETAQYIAMGTEVVGNAGLGTLNAAKVLKAKSSVSAVDIYAKAASAGKYNEAVKTGTSLGTARDGVKQWLQNAGSLERGQLIKDIESVGFKKVFDGKGMMHFERGGMKIRLDPPHSGTSYNHMHLNYGGNKSSYDIFLNPVNYKSSAAHIPIK